MSALTDADRRLLNFAGRTYRHAGAREQAIHDDLGMTPTRYFQRVNDLLDDANAYREFPMLIKRLRRVRDAGEVGRGERRLSTRLPRS